MIHKGCGGEVYWQVEESSVYNVVRDGENLEWGEKLDSEVVECSVICDKCGFNVKKEDCINEFEEEMS